MASDTLAFVCAGMVFVGCSTYFIQARHAKTRRIYMLCLVAGISGPILSTLFAIDHLHKVLAQPISLLFTIAYASSALVYIVAMYALIVANWFANKRPSDPARR